VSDAQELLSGAALAVFRLNGQFLAVAEELAAEVGLEAFERVVETLTRLSAALDSVNTVAPVAGRLDLPAGAR
jgi:hypothetical protein